MQTSRSQDVSQLQHESSFLLQLNAVTVPSHGSLFRTTFLIVLR